jgi:hypoxanthine phosphoribosyltransferase
MARQMTEDLPADFLMAPVLTGAFIFAADLLRALYKHGADPLVDFVQLSSYGGARASSGVVTLLKDFSVDVKGRHVLLVDDVLDSGRSLHFGKGMIEDRGAAAVKTCVLVKKLTGHAEDLKCDYIGFEAGADDFLIGYGMDDDARKRGVPFIGAG